MGSQREATATRHGEERADVEVLPEPGGGEQHGLHPGTGVRPRQLGAGAGAGAGGDVEDDDVA